MLIELLLYVIGTVLRVLENHKQTWQRSLPFLVGKIQQVSDTTKNTKLYVLESGKCYEAKKKKSDAG